MAEESVPLTKSGLLKLQEELDHLVNVRRAEVAQRLHDTRDCEPNTPAYEDALNEQAFLEGRILTLQTTIQNAVIIEKAHDHRRVRLGSSVTVQDHEGAAETYFIVGSAEADPRGHRISDRSPAGEALLGKSVGEDVQVKAPAGIHRWTIIGIS